MLLNACRLSKSRYEGVISGILAITGIFDTPALASPSSHLPPTPRPCPPPASPVYVCEMRALKLLWHFSKLQIIAILAT
jgi:hypothetical protein